ncbi:hypothetical protein IQ273_10070, partial [Nodosilinea sp. LEGE 07298]|nr:hypothetical protein [Nodosilinea sp. LEGE 07298]
MELAPKDRRPLRPVRRGLTLAPPSNLRLVPVGQRVPQAQPLPLS